MLSPQEILPIGLEDHAAATGEDDRVAVVLDTEAIRKQLAERPMTSDRIRALCTAGFKVDCCGLGL